MSGRKKPADETTFKRVLWFWTIASVVGGLIGGGVGMVWNAPFYFGFFLTLTLIGLIGLFALAVYVTNEQSRR